MKYKTQLMSIWTVLPCGAVISNRPFAHCCQIFTERNFPCAFFCSLEKSEEIYLFFFVALICYKDIIAKTLVLVKPFMALNYGLSITTLLLKHIFQSLSSISCKSFQSALQLHQRQPIIYRLIIQASRGAEAKGLDWLYVYMFWFVKPTWPAGLNPSFVPLYIIGDVSVQESFPLTNQN